MFEWLTPVFFEFSISNLLQATGKTLFQQVIQFSLQKIPQKNISEKIAIAIGMRSGKILKCKWAMKKLCFQLRVLSDRPLKSPASNTMRSYHFPMQNLFLANGPCGHGSM